jgi:predicted transcriptional regulator YdeE
MNIKSTEFYLIGLETRTDNKAEMTGQGEIPKMWQRIFQEGVQSKISHIIGPEMYAVYSNYESNEHGKYDFFVGYRAKDLSSVPAGLVSKKILSGNYKKLQTNKGPVYQVVGELWMKIWQMTPQDLGGPRAFRTDYEVYGAEAADPNQAVVDVYLGVL